MDSPHRTVRFTHWYRWHIVWVFAPDAVLAGYYNVPGALWIKPGQTLRVAGAFLHIDGDIFIDGALKLFGSFIPRGDIRSIGMVYEW